MTVVVPEQTPAGEAHLEPFLVELVHESLNSYAYSNAAFLCERLHAAAPTEVSRDFARVPPVPTIDHRSDGVTRRRPIPRASPHSRRRPSHRPPASATHPTHAGQRAPAGDVLLPRRPGQPRVPHPQGSHLPSVPLPLRALLRQAPKASRSRSRALPVPAPRGRPTARHGLLRRGAPRRERRHLGRPQRRARLVPPRPRVQRDGTR